MYMLTNMNWMFFLWIDQLYSQKIIVNIMIFFSNTATSKAKGWIVRRQKTPYIVFGLMSLLFSHGEWIITKIEMSHKNRICKFFQRIWTERTVPEFFYEASKIVLTNQMLISNLTQGHYKKRGLLSIFFMNLDAKNFK